MDKLHEALLSEHFEPNDLKRLKAGKTVQGFSLGVKAQKDSNGFSHIKAPELQAPALRKHARYGPSSMKRIIECNVSPFLSVGLEEEETEYSTEGTRAHELAEWMLHQKLMGSTGRPTIPIPTHAKDGILFDQAMIRHAKGYAEYCYAVVSDFLALPHSWYLEKKLVLDEELDIWGTADFVFMYEGLDGWHLILIDFKYGQGIQVVAEDNYQLGTYGLAGLTTFETAHKFIDVETHIYQPRSEHDIVPQIYGRQELIDKFAPRIQEAVERSENWFKANFISNDDISVYQKAGDHCQFCRAKGICRSYASYYGGGKVLTLLGLAAPMLDRLQTTKDAEHEAAKKEHKANKKEGIISEAPKKPNVYEDPKAVYATGVFSDEDLAYLALNASKITAFVESAKDALKAQLQSGKKNPFVMLGKASPTRAWDENEEKVISGLIALGIQEPASLETKLMSITEVEKTIGKDKIDHLTKVVRETVRIVPIGEEGVEPAPPRGLDVKAIIFGGK